MSLLTGRVPCDWKIAKVAPLFKAGKHDHMDNYRPISPLSVVSNVLEKAAHNQLVNCLKSNNHLSGTSKGHSTQATVTLPVEFIRMLNMQCEPWSFNSWCNPGGAILIDLCKAFDSVAHIHLLSKLTKYGIQDVRNCNGLQVI